MFATLLAVSCGRDEPTTPLGPSLSGGASPPCSFQKPGSFHHVGVVYGCGATIELSGDPAAAAAIVSGIAAWNEAFGHSPDGSTRSSWARDVPVLRWLGSSGGAINVVVQDGIGSDWCGAYTPTVPQLFEVRKSSTAFCTSKSNYSSMANLVLHELGHVLGYDNYFHGAEYGMPKNCVMNLTPDPTGPGPGINASLCQQEVEFILAAFGYTARVGITTSEQSAFWGSHIVTRLEGIPATKAIASEGSAIFEVTSLGFDAQNSSPGSGLAGMTFVWSADASSISFAPVIGTSTTATAGLGPAATVIRAVPTQSSIPSGYRVSSRLAIQGQTSAVTIDAPPGGGGGGGGGTGGFTITDITGPPTPITVPEDVEFKATVNNPPGSPVYYRWQISASNGAFPAINVENTSPTRSLVVPGGSYNIKVRVTPRVGSTTGTYREENWPVCTGGNLSLQGVPIGGGETPNAKEGC